MAAPHLAGRDGRMQNSPHLRRTTRSSLPMASWKQPFVRTSYAHNLVLPNIQTGLWTDGQVRIRCDDVAICCVYCPACLMTLLRTDGPSRPNAAMETDRECSMFPPGLFVPSLLVLVFHRGPAAWQAVVHGVKSGIDWDQRAFYRKFFEIADVGRVHTQSRLN